jgi:hypothetical protein
MWTFFAGPFLALLPRQWRDRLPARDKIHWRAAALVSGFAEGLLAFIALTYWYSYSVGGWARQAVFTAERRGAVIPESAEGFAGLALVAMNPLTWLLVGIAIEAAVRVFGAAFTGETLGTLPLYVIGRIVGPARINSESAAARSVTQSAGEKSAWRELREKYTLARLPMVPDELSFTLDNLGEILEIRSCRPKSDWQVPCTVSFDGAFYRLELLRKGARPRPFVFVLRRQAAGVLSRTVRIYAPDARPITTNR